MRTFEKRAHLRRRVRTFESQGSALDPVPFSRKVAPALASASIALFEKDFPWAWHPTPFTWHHIFWFEVLLLVFVRELSPV
jgi:hypothetical protein